MRLCLALASLLALCGAAQAGNVTADLSTSSKHYTKWKVYEVTNGIVYAKPPVYVGTFGFGSVPGVTIPFTNNDGFWYVQRHFFVPTDATNALLSISGLSVDDRVVVELNGVAVTSSGTTSAGAGEMQLTDPGTNVPYTFAYKAGPVSVEDSKDIVPGLNTLTIIVNNTDNGIFGPIVPVTKFSPSNAGIAAKVTYTTP